MVLAALANTEMEATDVNHVIHHAKPALHQTSVLHAHNREVNQSTESVIHVFTHVPLAQHMKPVHHV